MTAVSPFMIALALPIDLAWKYRCRRALAPRSSTALSGRGGSRAGLISVRVAELQEQQLAMHQQATAEAAANAKVTIESLIAEAEAARMKAMSEKGGAAAAVTALTAKAKLAGMWREKVDQHNTGSPVYERIERVIVERAPQSAPNDGGLIAGVHRASAIAMLPSPSRPVASLRK
jgi:hypothetical protein